MKKIKLIPVPPESGTPPAGQAPLAALEPLLPDDKDLRLLQLTKELLQTREQMRSFAITQEVANEELQSANEELLSSTEELRTLNEQLESSREALQRTVDTLTAVNREMIYLNEQVTSARNYAEAIVATTREPLLVLDKSLRIKTANRSFYTTYQVSKQQTEGRIIYDLGNNQWDIPELRTLLEQILPEKQSFFDLEVEHVFQTIGRRIMLLNAREMVDESRQEKMILLSIEDITDRRQSGRRLEESEAHYRLMADLMPDKIMNADAGGHSIYYNQRWLDYTGLSMDVLKSRGWLSFIHPDELGDVAEKWAHSVETGEDFEIEHRCRNKNGHYRWHLSRLVAVKNEQGNSTKWIGATTNIHLQKEQEQELEKAVKAGTRDLQQVNAALQKKNLKLVGANKELEAFAYISSHDLQEPLRKIQIFSNLILERERDSLSEKGKEYFGRIQESASRMQTLIQDLLAYSRTAVTDRKMEKIDLFYAIETVIADFKASITEKKGSIEAWDVGEAYAIPFQFRQMMFNLLGNALKFTNPAIPPKIVIQSALVRGGDTSTNEQLIRGRMYCHISITDNGIGFEPEYKDKIFEVFQRLRGKNEYEGTGIGLAIVKKIVENHDGIITATGALNHGARFDIYLPDDPDNGMIFLPEK